MFWLEYFWALEILFLDSWLNLVLLVKVFSTALQVCWWLDEAMIELVLFRKLLRPEFLGIIVGRPQAWASRWVSGITSEVEKLIKK